MQILNPFLIAGVFLFNLVLSELQNQPQCCMKVFANGSVSYTLDQATPEQWISSWTKDNLVIVGEDGDIHGDYVESQIENGYILRQRYSNVVCKLESPENGVSEAINCTDDCNSAQGIIASDTNSQFYTWLFIGISISVLLLLLLLIVGFLVYKWWKRSRRRVDGTDFEMQSVNVPGQNQD
ncbi:hypothetical protein PHYPO_G00000210 [Pangasianodon hypophthalmus]|uniref:Immunoglobulin V-set domain-containing protein n=1 Tax=Pangasianodon hypophthalmus TaxID=310915 RepID=A0A5N5Q598_PANHP|nr:hypothetical protein PHYPO_G00000210 [Pangasianodon hypophthalmus]